jgi:hypothetical protein
VKHREQITRFVQCENRLVKITNLNWLSRVHLFNHYRFLSWTLKRWYAHHLENNNYKLMYICNNIASSKRGGGWVIHWLQPESWPCATKLMNRMNWCTYYCRLYHHSYPLPVHYIHATTNYRANTPVIPTCPITIAPYL